MFGIYADGQGAPPPYPGLNPPPANDHPFLEAILGIGVSILSNESANHIRRSWPRTATVLDYVPLACLILWIYRRCVSDNSSPPNPYGVGSSFTFNFWQSFDGVIGAVSDGFGFACNSIESLFENSTDGAGVTSYGYKTRQPNNRRRGEEGDRPKLHPVGPGQSGEPSRGLAQAARAPTRGSFDSGSRSCQMPGSSYSRRDLRADEPIMYVTGTGVSGSRPRPYGSRPKPSDDDPTTMYGVGPGASTYGHPRDKGGFEIKTKHPEDEDEGLHPVGAGETSRLRESAKAARARTSRSFDEEDGVCMFRVGAGERDKVRR